MKQAANLLKTDLVNTENCSGLGLIQILSLSTNHSSENSDLEGYNLLPSCCWRLQACPPATHWHLSALALPLLSSSARSCEEITGSPFTAHAKTGRALHKKADSSRYLYTYRVIEPHELLHGYLDCCIAKMPDKSKATLGQTTQAKLYL